MSRLWLADNLIGKKASKFKVGMRVELIKDTNEGDSGFLVKGRKGKIVCFDTHDSSDVGVVFDGFKAGHNLSKADYHGAGGWYVASDSIKKIGEIVFERNPKFKEGQMVILKADWETCKKDDIGTIIQIVDEVANPHYFVKVPFRDDEEHIFREDELEAMDSDFI